jgi:signal transduction histidine kinase
VDPDRHAAPSAVWPLLPLAPAVVLLLGVAMAVAIGTMGLSNLATESDRHAAVRAQLLATALAARIAPLPSDEQLEILQQAARKTGAELVVVTPEGKPLLDASLGRTPVGELRRAVAERSGQATAGLGRVRFAVQGLRAPSRGMYLIAFVREPSTPEGAPALLRALVALTTLLVGVAGGVAYAVARDANKDVDFVAARVRGMLQVRSEPTGEAVPVRTMDEVGALTVAFNELVERFAAAQRGAQNDLKRVQFADRDRAAFLAAVSHELRSPLNAILGFADVLMAEVDGPLSAEAREEVEQILGSGKHLLDLINDILELSALEGGQLKLSRTKVDLVAIAGEVVREALGLVGARPVSVRIEGAPVVHARADPKRVRQVVTNLVGNAVKFTQAGEVVVDVGQEGRFARLSVRDTGPGIGSQQRALLFQEYKQTKEERARRRGTGLGLATSRRLALMHGGTIQVESEIGQGSTFKVLLPLWEGGPPRRDRGPAPAGGGSSGSLPPSSDRASGVPPIEGES